MLKKILHPNFLCNGVKGSGMKEAGTGEHNFKSQSKQQSKHKVNSNLYNPS